MSKENLNKSVGWHYFFFWRIIFEVFSRMIIIVTKGFQNGREKGNKAYIIITRPLLRQKFTAVTAFN